MKRICVIEHHPSPEEDAATAHLRARGCEVTVLRPYLGERLPDPAETDGALLMGGPQMITEIDAAPYLHDEAAFALAAIALGRPLLAICLGAQLLAHALGARVGPRADGAVAFGFHGLEPTPEGAGLFPPGLRVLSGNAQGFEIPDGAVKLAAGPIWPNQAYRIGSALAFQFHPEVTRGILDDWQRELASYVGRPGASDIAAQDADFAAWDPALKAWFGGVLDAHLGLAPDAG